MKKSYIKFYFILGVILLLLYSFYVVFSEKKTPATTSSTQSGQASVKNGDLAMPAKDGGTVEVKDFTKSPQKVLESTDVIVENDQYTISYFTTDQSFLITILAQPAQQNRSAAEEALMEKLNISQSDACKLTVALTVPAFVSESLAGKDWGLSFCPNGTVFPAE